ncbi:hypothetical protein ABES80_13175 [Bacillus gobiensis]|uniref:hypothetical protein n=1 Tax=Bacillus gobiensis TaxID=1441095 RepID=UPI003D1C5F57
MTKNNENYEQIQKIMKQIQGFQDNEIDKTMADINSRVENVIRYNRYEDSEIGRSNPEYYRIKKVRNLHNTTVEAYTNMYTDDVKAKFSVISEIFSLDKKLTEIEGRSKQNEDDEE